MKWGMLPTSAEVSDALKKGLGRAHYWSAAGRVPAEDLLQACLCDYRFDKQCEEVRSVWLWRLLQASSRVHSFRETILKALASIEETGAEEQLCQLARYYGAAGDGRFVSQLRRIVLEKPVEHIEWLGEKELITLAGEDGFLVAARRHGEDLTLREWEWFDLALVDTAVEHFGDEMVRRILRKASVDDAYVLRFLDAWTAEVERQVPVSNSSYRERLASYVVHDVIKAAEHPRKDYFPLRGWGRKATVADIATVYERLLRTTDAEVIRKYLQVFSARAWPRFEDRMLELCEHDDENIRLRASAAVKNNRHEEVRRFALAHINDAELHGNVIEMLSANYKEGDEVLLVRELVLPEDKCHLHSVLMAVRKLLQDNPGANIEEAVALVYEHTPCSACRYSVVKLRKERVGLSEELLAECQFDVEADTRQLAGAPAWNDEDLE